MCETCREAPGFGLAEKLEEPCTCPCAIKANSPYLKHRPLVCHECSHIACE